MSIFSCHGWKILTNEGIGGPLTGYNEVQTALAENNGSQCGYVELYDNGKILCVTHYIVTLFILNLLMSLLGTSPPKISKIFSHCGIISLV